MFYNELDILEYRLNILYDHIDHFILVESTRTHKGNEKPLFYDSNKERFAKFNDKIVHIIVTDLNPNPEVDYIDNFLKDGVWKNENYQRQCIDVGIKHLNLSPEDIIIISDVDEIPNIENIKYYTSKEKIGIIKLAQFMYYYNLTTINIAFWIFSYIISYEEYKKEENRDINIIRITHEKYNILENGGWHLSYFGDPKFIQNKLQQFAHQEYNNELYTNIDYITYRMKNNEDLFGRKNETYLNIPIENNIYLPPKYEKYLTKFIGMPENKKKDVK